MPSGGSKTILYDYLINVLGTFGLNSIVKKILNLSLGCSLNNFFSNSLNHDVAKWTFFNITHDPFLTLELIA